MYNNCERKTIEKFIKKNFGKIKTIIKEAIEITGIDIALVFPTKDMPYYKLATIGLQHNKKGDITENMIRKEHGLNLRGAYYLYENN